MPMQTPEGRVQSKLAKYAESRGLTVIRMAFRPGARAGWPDLQILAPGGYTLFMEIKRPNKSPTPLQWRRIIQLRKLFFRAHWTDNYTEGRQIIDGFIEETQR